jgi:DNA-binding HxlR family transcriptional regulator
VTWKSLQGGTFLKPKHPVHTEECRPVSELLARVGDKWSVLVVSLLGDGALRFSALRRMIDGISQKMLTTTLRSLERDGFVTRTVYPTTPPSVAYELTELGRDLLVPVGALADWARQNQGRVEAARRKFDLQHSRSTGAQAGVLLPAQLRG